MIDPTLQAAGVEASATEQELQASLLIFKAERLRGDATRLNRATEAAHAALQAQYAGSYGYCSAVMNIASTLSSGRLP